MELSPKDALKTIRIIHFALASGITLFSLVLIFLYFDGALGSEPIEVMEYIPVFLFLVAMPTSNVMYKQSLRNVDSATNLKTKMATFQTAHIIRMAILEGSALFAAVVVFVNGSLYQLIIVGLTLALFASKTPSVMMLESDLDLTSEEKEKFK